MKYLGIDYGLKRTGLAISNDDGTVAVLKETIQVESQQQVIDRIKEIVAADNVETVVLGVPVSMNGEHSEMTDHVERFITKLRNHLSIPVQTIDERLTTEMANTLLRGVNKDHRDQVAAQILLQNFLDQRSND